MFILVLILNMFYAFFSVSIIRFEQVILLVWQKMKGYTQASLIHTMQRNIWNSLKHLRWSMLRKQLTAFSRQLFLQGAPSQMFDRVLNTPQLDINNFTKVMEIYYETVVVSTYLKILLLLYLGAFQIMAESHVSRFLMKMLWHFFNSCQFVLK